MVVFKQSAQCMDDINDNLPQKMSGRALRKLQRLQEEKSKNISNREESDAEDFVAPAKAAGNAFSMLLQDDDDEEVEEEVEEEDKEVDVYTPEEQVLKVIPKKKKKKKSKGLSKNTNDLDEIDLALKEVNEKLGFLPIQENINADAHVVDQDASMNVFYRLLSINTSLLDWENEMLKNFGRDAVNAALGPNQVQHSQQKRKKRSFLVNPKSTWPPAGISGLGMELVDPETLTFSLTHSSAYQTLEMMFYQSVATLNPETLHIILRENHYHILALIQLSEVFKQNGDVPNATDFIERALYVFENSLHARYNFSTGNCRLDYDRIETRPVFIAVFRHIQYLARRGVYKCAFEFTKLLFSFDPEDDPLCSLLFFDFYCIKAEAFSYFVEFYNTFNPGKGLELLPSFCFSKALCQWELERIGKKDHSKSSQLLRTAILTHPEVIGPLFAKLEINETSVLNHAFFKIARPRGPQGLSEAVIDILVMIYAESSNVLWKIPELLNWLKATCSAVLRDIDSKREIETITTTQNLPFTFETNLWIPLSLARLLVLSDDPNFIKKLPKGAMNGLMTFDPFPPTYAIASAYDPLRPRSGLRGERSDEAGGGLFNYLRQSMFG